MAEAKGAWGIDVGQAGLKAVRLRFAEAASQAIAVAFDYIPYPKILSQPDADPAQLVSEALDTFLSRNEVAGDAIAISVPGQTALARFIQLPPVESKKVAEIVRYEARQQIPFALEDVIWDYQPLGGGTEESGFMLGAEVGLFAMKRDQVEHHMQPFLQRKFEIELVQIAPLAVYNFLAYDLLGARAGETFDAGAGHIVALDMGTDNTTLIVTNGVKIWIRNVPIGGNHFTRALTKDMKLTFAKAEHLKCNATKSPDPRAVFQALRPVFNDYVSEIQRSIGYFASVNREAKIEKIVGVGNGFKLAGLQKFLQQNLQYEVERVDTFQALVGDAVLNAPLFQENILTFAVPYGLALQSLGLTNIRTTLLPPEIVMTRTIRRKKPWAVVAAAALLFGLSLSAVGYSSVASSVSTGIFGKVEGDVDGLKKKADSHKSTFDTEKGKNKSLADAGAVLVKPLEKRNYWLEVYRAINECLPRDIGKEKDERDITKKNRINIHSVTNTKFANLGDWFSKLPAARKEHYMIPDDQNKSPEGEGYVFEIRGEHFHHDEDIDRQGIMYVRNTLLANLQRRTMQQPGTPQPVPVRQIGITHATILDNSRPIAEQYFPNGPPRDGAAKGAGGRFGSGEMAANRRFGAPTPGAFSGAVSGTPRPAGNTAGAEKAVGDQPTYITITKTTFTLAFVWKETPVGLRVQEPPPTEAAAPGTSPAAATGTAPAAPPGAAPATAAPASPPASGG